MMVERYPNLKEDVGDSIPRCEISSPLDIKLAIWSTASCALVLACRPSVSKEKEKERRTPNNSENALRGPKPAYFGRSPRYTEAKIQTRSRIYESPWLLPSVKPYTNFPISSVHPQTTLCPESLWKVHLAPQNVSILKIYPHPTCEAPPSCSIALARGASPSPSSSFFPHVNFEGTISAFDWRKVTAIGADSGSGSLDKVSWRRRRRKCNLQASSSSCASFFQISLVVVLNLYGKRLLVKKRNSVSWVWVERVCCHFFVFGSSYFAGIRARFAVSVLSVVRVLGSQLLILGVMCL